MSTPRAVTVTSHEDRSAMVTIEGLCNLPLSESEARALWVGLGNHLCEPAGPGLDRRATPTPDGGVMRNGGISYPSPAMKARTAVLSGLEWMWRQTYQSTPTEADLKGMARILKEMAS